MYVLQTEAIKPTVSTNFQEFSTYVHRPSVCRYVRPVKMSFLRETTTVVDALTTLPYRFFFNHARSQKEVFQSLHLELC